MNPIDTTSVILALFAYLAVREIGDTIRQAAYFKWVGSSLATRCSQNVVDLNMDDLDNGRIEDAGAKDE